MPTNLTDDRLRELVNVRTGEQKCPTDYSVQFEDTTAAIRLLLSARERLRAALAGCGECLDNGEGDTYLCDRCCREVAKVAWEMVKGERCLTNPNA